MKDFFDQYGKTVISTLVITALIAVCSIIRPVITDALDDMTGKLGNYVSERFENIGAESTGGEEIPVTTGETWVLQGFSTSGFVPYIEGKDSDTITISGNFCGSTFTKLVLQYNFGEIFQITDDVDCAYNFLVESPNKHAILTGGGTPTNQYFVFDEAPTGDLLTWLQENAVKQGPQPSVFTVSGTYNHQISTNKYSLDNGATWNNIGSTGTGTFTIENVSQIKFKCDEFNVSQSIASTKLSLDIYGQGVESENFTLTQDIDDIDSNVDSIN